MFNNMLYFFRFSRQTDTERLCKAVNAVIRNHPALAMTIRFDEEGDLVQVYSPQIIPEIRPEYMSDLEIIRLSSNFVRPFKKVHVPVFRRASSVNGRGVAEHRACRHCRGEELPRDYYCAYLAREQEIRKTPQSLEDKEYFEQNYGGFDWCVIPEPDKQDELQLEAESRQIKLPFDEEDLSEAEKRLHASRSVIAIAAAILALHEFSGKNDIMTNWIFNNLLGSYASNSVGMLIKNLPVGIHMDKIDGLKNLLAEVKRQVTDGIAH